MWRQNRWRTNVEFLSIEYPEYIDPWILKRLKEGRGIQLDENYAYRLSGRNNTIIERVLREQYDIDGPKAFHIPREKVDHSFDPTLTKIPDFTEPPEEGVPPKR